MKTAILLTVFVGAVAVVTPIIVAGDDATPSEDRSPQELLRYFSDTWDEASWLPKSRRQPDGYMRPDDDEGWKARMVVLQKLVAADDAALQVLTDTLKSESVPERILAAQTLSYFILFHTKTARFRSAVQGRFAILLRLAHE
jgi:hypothetical protein